MSSTALSDQGDQDVPLDRVVRRVRRTPVVVGKDASAVFVTRKRPFVHVLGEVLRLLGKHGYAG